MPGMPRFSSLIDNDMSEKSKGKIKQLDAIAKQLEEWHDQDPDNNNFLLLALATDREDKDTPYSTLCEVRGSQGAVLTAFRDLISEAPGIADIMSMAINYTPQHTRYLS